jgi:hypothetical protein
MTNRPPIRNCPVFARCTVCQRVFKGRVDLVRDPPCTLNRCAWCHRQVLVCA